jgi:hypothetical protein
LGKVIQKEIVQAKRAKMAAPIAPTIAQFAITLSAADEGLTVPDWLGFTELAVLLVVAGMGLVVVVLF